MPDGGRKIDAKRPPSRGPPVSHWLCWTGLASGSQDYSALAPATRRSPQVPTTHLTRHVKVLHRKPHPPRTLFIANQRLTALCLSGPPSLSPHRLLGFPCLTNVLVLVVSGVGWAVPLGRSPPPLTPVLLASNCCFTLRLALVRCAPAALGAWVSVYPPCHPFPLCRVIGVEKVIDDAI